MSDITQLRDGKLSPVQFATKVAGVQSASTVGSVQLSLQCVGLKIV